MTEPNPHERSLAVRFFRDMPAGANWTEALAQLLADHRAAAQATLGRVRELVAECDRSLSPRDVVDAIGETLESK